MLTEDDIKNAMKAVKYPGYSRDIVSFGLVKQVAVNSGAVSITLDLTSGSPEIAQQLKTQSEQALKALPGITAVYVQVNQPAAASAPAGQNPLTRQPKVPGISRIVAVASGKGGGGKSTLSVNLACGLEQ